MTALFFVSLAVVLYTYAGYPICIAWIARLKPQPWKRAIQAGSASVILPVHNGLAMLPTKLASLTAMDAALIHEIIVVCDGCTDESVAWLQTQDDPRLQTIVLPQHAGKASAISHGISAATGEFLLFVDVRPDVTEPSIRELLSNFADPAVGCVAGELHIHAGGEQSEATSAVGGFYWRYEQWIRNNEALYDSPVGVYGGYYAIRRSLAVPPPAGLILDDMFQPLSIIRQGYRSVVDEQAIVHDRWPATASGEFQRKVRTLAGNFQLIAMCPWVVSPKNRVLFQLVSHKLLRLLVPYCLIAMLVAACVLAVHSPYWTVIACVQIAVWCAALLALRVRLPLVGKLASACGALLLLNAAAVQALWVFLFTPGPLWKIWNATPAPRQSEHAH